MEIGRWLLNRLSLKLADVPAVIEPALIEQRLMHARLNDLAVIDDHQFSQIATRGRVALHILLPEAANGSIIWIDG